MTERPHAKYGPFEVGDEVVGDPRSRSPQRGVIVGIEDVPLPSAVEEPTRREYYVKISDGRTLYYLGESSLRLVKKATKLPAPEA